jgi:hypothetical protein
MTRARTTQGPATRRRPVTEAVASPHLEGLDLAALRAYRSELMAEEDRVSYWRRLAHARIDLLEAESSAEGVLSFDDLVRVLGDTGAGRVRHALVRVRPSDPLPDLPVLEEMWATEVDPHDPWAVGEALDRLRSAEKQLTEYRRALHERIDEATSELIVRYRRDPASALVALPEG